MQLHMFWALYIHAADAQDVTGDWEKQARGLGRPAQPAAALLGLPAREGHARAPPRPGARRDARELHHPRRLRRVVGEEGERLHPLLARARRHPRHDDDGLVRRLPPRRHRVLRAMAAKNTAPQRLLVGPWSHVGMRGDVTYTLDVDFGPDSRWGVQRYFEEQLEYFDRWLREDGSQAAGWAPSGKPVRIFVMGGGSGRKTRAREARPRRPLARRGRVAARARRADDAATSTATDRSGTSRRRRAASRGTSPTTRRTRCRRSAASTAPSASSRRGRRTSSRCGRGSSTRRSGCGTS